MIDFSVVDSQYKDTAGTENLYPFEASIIRSNEGQVNQPFRTADCYRSL